MKKSLIFFLFKLVVRHEVRKCLSRGICRGFAAEGETTVSDEAAKSAN